MAMRTGWRATQADIDEAMGLMAGLQPHPTVSADRTSEVWRWVWRTCLEGDVPGKILVARCDLREAVHRILNGALGSEWPWHPSPPQLRMLCNSIQVERRFGICLDRISEAKP